MGGQVKQKLKVSAEKKPKTCAIIRNGLEMLELHVIKSTSMINTQWGYITCGEWLQREKARIEKQAGRLALIEGGVLLVNSIAG